MGAAYLIYLGIKSFLHRNSDALAIPQYQQVEQKLYKKGILMNILNPKVLLFFIAFFPQFVNPEKTNVSGELLLLGVLFMLQAWLVFSFVAILSDKLSRRLMQQKHFSLVMHYLESFIYFAIGISLIFVGI